MKSFLKKNQKELKNLFQKNKVTTAYLFGSTARGDDHSSSDVDIAVLFPENFSQKERFEKRLKLMGSLGRILHKPIDLIVLNDVSLFFRYAILEEGNFFYQKEELDRIEFESRTFAQYFDFAPFLEEYNHQYVKTHVQ